MLQELRDGLAFSVPRGVPLPASLKNIFKELENNSIKAPAHGDLSAWTSQGVLLLNRMLTVESGKAGAHANLGWRPVTKALLEGLLRDHKPLALMLWGRAASKGISASVGEHACIFESPHPSPKSAHLGFFYSCERLSREKRKGAGSVGNPGLKTLFRRPGGARGSYQGLRQTCATKMRVCDLVHSSTLLTQLGPRFWSR